MHTIPFKDCVLCGGVPSAPRPQEPNLTTSEFFITTDIFVVSFLILNNTFTLLLLIQLNGQDCTFTLFKFPFFRIIISIYEFILFFSITYVRLIIFFIL